MIVSLPCLINKRTLQLLGGHQQHNEQYEPTHNRGEIKKEPEARPLRIMQSSDGHRWIGNKQQNDDDIADKTIWTTDFQE